MVRCTINVSIACSHGKYSYSLVVSVMKTIPNFPDWDTVRIIAERPLQKFIEPLKSRARSIRIVRFCKLKTRPNHFCLRVSVFLLRNISTVWQWVEKSAVSLSLSLSLSLSYRSQGAATLCAYSRFVAIHENSLSNRMDSNDEWRMWTIRIFSPHYSRITYESRITHYESRIWA